MRLDTYEDWIEFRIGQMLRYREEEERKRQRLLYGRISDHMREVAEDEFYNRGHSSAIDARSSEARPYIKLVLPKKGKRKAAENAPRELRAMLILLASEIARWNGK